MKIKYRILVAPFITILFLMICGAVAFRAISVQEAALEEINGTRLINMQHGVATAERISAVHTDMFRLVSWFAAYDTDTQNQLKQAIGDKLLSIRDDLQRWSEDPQLTGDERSRVLTLLEQLDSYKLGADDALFMLDLDVTSALGSMRNVENLFLALKETFDGFNQLQKKMAGGVFEAVRSHSQQALMLNAVLLIAAIVIAALLALTTAHRLLRQLGGEPADAVRIASQIAEGDLSPNCTKAPEGSLLASMAVMQASLRNMLGVLNQHACQLSDQAQQMSRSSQAVAGSSDRQSQAAAEISATIEELTANINGVFAHAQMATDLSQQSGQQAKDGSQTILSTTREMEAIASSVQTVSASISELGASSERISSVITVIQSVAEQTNLLALNAAIEAARAGEQGRGFAVVADEVRGLAARTAESTGEISAMINVIQSEVAAAVAAMQTTVDQVQQGVNLAKGAGQAVTQISDAAEQALTAVNDITQALREQTLATDDIAASIANIAEMSTTNSHRAQDSAGDAKQLEQLSQEIHQAIARFRC